MNVRTFLAAFLAAALGWQPAAQAAPTAPAAEPKAREASKDKDAVPDVLAAHNRERAEAKLPPLTLDPKLTAAAEAHARDMAAHAKMTHEGSDGSTPTDRIKRQDYHFQSLGENVAQGYPTVEALMKGWMDSPPHRANILGKFSQIGIAVARDADDSPYWCTDFGTPFVKHDPAAAAEDLVRAINAERSTAGLPPLKSVAKLQTAASRIARAYATADALDSKEQGEDLLGVLGRVGYRYRAVAESAASGQPGAGDVVKTWMASPSHKSHILGDFREVGVGYAASKAETPYWCLVLATPAGD